MNHFTRSTILLFGLFFVMVGSCVAQQPAIKVGEVTAQAGRMVSGFIDVPAKQDEGVRIPITVVRGARPGPTLALIAGTHGSEYAPIIGLQRLRPLLDAQKLSGTVILVHVANMPSYLRRTIYYSPIDGKNLNRVYPGKVDGTSSERIAYAITKEVIEQADYLVDLHCGDGNESLRPYTYWTKSGTATDEPSKQMALAFGLDHIIIDTDRPKDPNASIYCANTANTRGKPAITIESGGLGQTDDISVAAVTRGCLNLLRLFKMIEGEAKLTEHPIWIDRSEVLRSTATGIFYPSVEKGHTVAQGTTLGYVTDFFGNRVMEVRAPFAGAVLYVIGTPAVNQGEPLAFVGRIVNEPPK